MRIKVTYLIVVFSLIRSLSFAQAPTATIIVPANTICSDVVYTFSSTTTGSITAYSWSVTPAFDFTFTPNNFSNSVSVQFSSPSTYSLTLFVANGTGTFATGVLVTVVQSAKASYNATIDNAGLPANLTLKNYSSYFSNVSWNFGVAAPPQSGIDAFQTYSVGGTYSVSMVAFGRSGCNDTLNYNFVIDDFSSVVLPNVFTPNNDGVNDVFKPIAKGLAELKVWVYNRWGVLMYQWDGVNGFWDGYTTSGELATEGVYFYVLEAKGLDSKSYKMKNNLTLTR